MTILDCRGKNPKVPFLCIPKILRTYGRTLQLSALEEKGWVVTINELEGEFIRSRTSNGKTILARSGIAVMCGGVPKERATRSLTTR
jgi:hypothetical protein